jgi:hypothetical protein
MYIMETFSNSEEDFHSLALHAPYAMANGKFDTLMGMFGANRSNIEENGNAVLSLASDAYRQYMEFIEALSFRGFLNTDPLVNSDFYIDKIGWWNIDIRQLITPDVFSGSQDYGKSLAAFANEPGVKLLLAPPEIGPDGKSGADHPGSGTLNRRRWYYINAEVSDEKLAKILEIYDALSFEPDLNMMSVYGIAGEDFDWLGEPYNSPVIKKPEPVNGDNIMAFSTHTNDGDAGKYIYSFSSETMNAFYGSVSSSEAVSRNIPPFRFPAAASIERANTLLSNFSRFAQGYLNDIVSGKKTVAESWDSYINTLKMMGLDEYHQLINSLM